MVVVMDSMHGGAAAHAHCAWMPRLFLCHACQACILGEEQLGPHRPPDAAALAPPRTAALMPSLPSPLPPSFPLFLPPSHPPCCLPLPPSFNAWPPQDYIGKTGELALAAVIAGVDTVATEDGGLLAKREHTEKVGVSGWCGWVGGWGGDECTGGRGVGQPGWAIMGWWESLACCWMIECAVSRVLGWSEHPQCAHATWRSMHF